MLSKFDELKLIARCMLGDDRRAFGVLVENYQTEIRRFFLNLTFGDAALSDDLAQETFIKAWININHFRGDAKLSTWLYKIATNESITFLNKERNRPASSIDDEDSFLINNLEADKWFDGDDLKLELQKAINKLPEKQRLVFNMRYFDEMKYEDMSEILDTSVGALKASYHHAVKKIEDFFSSID